MKTKLVKFLSLSRYSTECTKCLQFRRYCSKNNDKSSTKSDEETEGSPEYLKDPEKLIEFEAPEKKIKLSDYAKPLPEYFKEDLKMTFKFLKRKKDFTLDRRNFPYDVEFLILGAGPIGSAVAFWLKKTFRTSIPVLVVDKNLSFDKPQDASEAQKVSLQSSLCTLRQEYELKENVELSAFGAEFIRNMDRYAVSDLKFPDVPYQPFGFLTLSDKKSAEKLKQIHSDCLLWKGNNELLTPYQLEQRYPWLNTDQVELAIHGLKNEGWFDPDIFLMKMRAFAVDAGAKFVEAELLEFVFEENEGRVFPGYKQGDYRPIHNVYLKTTEGDIRKVEFSTCIVCLGPEIETVAKDMLHLDKKYSGMHHFEIPITSRKRYLYNISCPEGGPSISSPLIVDPTGLFIKRYGPLNEFICGCPPPFDDELNNLSENEFFEKIVWPILANRIPVFENLKLLSSQTYYEDYNTYDGAPFFGFHPAYHNFIFITGFGHRCHEHAPGLGRAISEIYTKGTSENINLFRLSFNRLVQEVPLFDSCTI